jgi:metal-dependent amidase/aminoacylase/carboxypeptidase family protein
VLRGTIRSYSPEVREKLLAGVRRTAGAAAMMGGAPEPAIELAPGGLAVVNDEAVVGRTVAALRGAFGDSKVVAVPPITASEDFSEFVNAGVPSMFFFVGVLAPEEVAASKKPGGKPIAFNHSPFFAPVPEPSIKTGVEAMSVAVLTTMASK